MSQFRILPARSLDNGVGCQRPRHNLPDQVSLDSPAIDIMTDLSTVAAETVPANIAVDDAEEKMIASGAHLLFVTSQLKQVIGIVTSRDLSGELILRHVNDSQTARKDLIVRDIMTPQHRVKVLEMGDVATARVGDIVATLNQHALVVDRGRDDKQTIRGLLSASQISQQLGQAIDTSEIAGSLAELARAS